MSPNKNRREVKIFVKSQRARVYHAILMCCSIILALLSFVWLIGVCEAPRSDRNDFALTFIVAGAGSIGTQALCWVIRNGQRRQAESVEEQSALSQAMKECAFRPHEWGSKYSCAVCTKCKRINKDGKREIYCKILNIQFSQEHSPTNYICDNFTDAGLDGYVDQLMDALSHDDRRQNE